MDVGSDLRTGSECAGLAYVQPKHYTLNKHN